MKRLVAIALAGILACEEEAVEHEAVVAVPEIEVPLIEFAGCAELEDGVCMLAPWAPRIDIWIDVHAEAELDVRLDGQSAEFTRHAADGGLRIRLAAPSGSTRVEANGVDPRWSESWSLELADLAVPPPLAHGRELLTRGEFTEAIAVLEAGLPTVSDAARVQMLDMLRRIHHNVGNRDAALDRCLEEAELARRLGHPIAESNALSAAAYLAGYEGTDTEAARRYVARVREHADALPEARINAAYQTSLIARRAGDVMVVLEELTEAERVAVRLGRPEMAGIATNLAHALGDLGRGAEALAAVRRSLDLTTNVTCSEQARKLNTVGFTQLLLAEQGLEHEPARPLLDAALALVEPEGECPLPKLHAEVLVNLALEAVENAEPEEALEHLGTIDDLPAPLESWVGEIHGRVGLDTGRWELIPSLMQLPDPKAPLVLRWAALERQGRLLDAFGLDDAATASYISAEALLEEATNGIGIEVGQDLFLAGRSSSSRALVRLLLEAGRDEEAFCRARLARSRALRRLDRIARIRRAPVAVREQWSDAVRAFSFTRDRLVREAESDWQLSESERERLRARRDVERHAAERGIAAAFDALGSRGELPDCASLPAVREREQIVLPFPLDEGWVAFVVDLDGVIAVEVPAASALIDAIAPLLHAPRVRILPTGQSWEVPFHALGAGTRALMDQTIVSYGLDLDTRGNVALARQVLIVSDPSEDLPMARLEADAVADRLRAAGWSIETRTGGAATRTAIAADLADAALLHYAGHGVHRGASGWGAALLLPGGDVLGVADILALPAVPQHVVLTGCETGYLSATPGGGMNLGRAFVFAGAEAAVVADVRVDDALARRVGESLYEDAASLDLTASLRNVQRRLRDEGTPEWEVFRVLTR